MHIFKQALLGCAGLAVSGCATTSFAPPMVALKTYEAPTLEDAIRDVDDFIQAYRIAANHAANGRSAFEVPAFLTSVGALTAVGFGAGKDVALAAGAAGATLNGGNAYFAPKAKGAILRRGVEAFECIQQVATGVKPFNHSTNSEARSFAEAVNGGTSNQFYLVRNAAVSVDNIIGDRLSDAGSLASAQALATEYEKLVKQRIAEQQNAQSAGFVEAAGVTAEATERVATMQSDLQLCVLRARN